MPIMTLSPPPFVTSLRCILCGVDHPPGDLLTCSRCGSEGILDVQYDYAGAAGSMTRSALVGRPCDHWRYRELLPVSPALSLSHPHIGWTPIYAVPALGEELGLKRLLLKDEGRNPTGSFKDRASSVGVLKAMEFGYSSIACASTGNAASSLAGIAAAIGIRSYIFVPRRAPEPKITQLLIFGATVFRVEGSYEDAFELCRKSCISFGWYSRNSGTNPYLVEGKKTAGFEIAEQVGDALPDWLVVPVGDGCTVGGIGKGLREMQRLGAIPRVPRLLGVQAEGARPIVDAFHSGRDLVAGGDTTIADSIAVGMPRNWRRAINEVRLSGGGMIAVSDDDILEAMRLTARLGGVFGEPAGVTGVAGLKKALQAGIVRADESALVVITGNGLKDIQTARAAVGKEFGIPPDLHAVESVLSRIGERR